MKDIVEYVVNMLPWKVMSEDGVMYEAGTYLSAMVEQAEFVRNIEIDSDAAVDWDGDTAHCMWIEDEETKSLMIWLEPPFQVHEFEGHFEFGHGDGALHIHKATLEIEERPDFRSLKPARQAQMMEAARRVVQKIRTRQRLCWKGLRPPPV